MAWKGSSHVEKGTGRLPCLTWLSRSSSTPDSNTPSLTRQAAGSWKAAFIPRVYMHPPLTGFHGSADSRQHAFQSAGRPWPAERLRQEIADRSGDQLRRHEAQAVVVPFGADTLVAILAGHIVVENPVRDAPRRVLRV